VIRVRYFDGQLLSAADFQAEQDYVRARFRRLHRWLHGWGIVGGLGVSLQQGQIVVAPGLAIDCVGEEIEVAQPTSVALPAGGKVSHLTLAYAERAVDPQPALFDPPAAVEMSIQYRRIEEGRVLTLEAADPSRRHARNPCGRAHPIVIARLVRVGSRWRLDRRFRPGRARS
jgi:hypothetical protein